jgi:hypothetical protein
MSINLQSIFIPSSYEALVYRAHYRMSVLRQPPLVEGVTQNLVGEFRNSDARIAATMTSSQPVAVTPNGKRGQHHSDIANGVNKESRAIPTLRWHRRLI